MKGFFLSGASILAVFFSLSWSNAGIELRVTGDRVSLRAAASPTAELVGQVSSGDLLFTDNLEGEWIAVAPPSGVDFWVYGELVRDGVSAVPDLRVRSGPGINYPAVGRIEKGGKVDVRGVQGDWLRITPPAGTVVWVSRTYVEEAALAKPVTPPQREPPAVPPAPSVSPPGVPVPSAPRPAITPKAPPSVTAPQPVLRPSASPSVSNPASVRPVQPAETSRVVPRNERVLTRPAAIDPGKLVATMVQGENVSLTGVLRRSGWVWRCPSRYRLVQYDAQGRDITACYVLGDERELESRLNSRVTLHGKAYWVQGVREQVVFVTD